MRVVESAVVRLIEKIEHDGWICSVAASEGGPKEGCVRIRQRRDELAVGAEGAIGIEPLKIEEGIGSVSGGGRDDGVDLIEVVLTSCRAAAMESPVLVERDAENVRAPIQGPVGYFGRGDNGPLSRLGVFQARAIDASKENRMTGWINEV